MRQTIIMHARICTAIAKHSFEPFSNRLNETCAIVSEDFYAHEMKQRVLNDWSIRIEYAVCTGLAPVGTRSSSASAARSPHSISSVINRKEDKAALAALPTDPT